LNREKRKRKRKKKPFKTSKGAMKFGLGTASFREGPELAHQDYDGILRYSSFLPTSGSRFHL